jgi:hypothetical protein
MKADQALGRGSNSQLSTSLPPKAIQKLIASADNAGCSPDLTVVAAADLEALKVMSQGL